MDYWLIYSLSLLVFILLIHTLIANKMDKGLPEVARRVNWIGAFVVGLASLVFHLLFWIHALKNRSLDYDEMVEEYKLDNYN